MAASFSHPNIVPVYAVEEDGQSLAFVMGFVEGESLAERVKRAGPLSTRELVRLLLDVAYALAYAHGRGVVHRDIKPDNIMIERATGRALLMDFGVARSIAATPVGQAGMTRVGEVVGTPEYMSPEQATGEAIDGRSDLYSLGLTAYFAATGSVAYTGDSAARILVRQLTEVLPPLSSVRGDLPPALSSAIDRTLAKERDDRFADAAALIEELDAAQSAAPEVPLAIRLLANELRTLLLVMMFMLIFCITAANLVLRTQGNLDVLAAALAMLAVLVGRILQVRSEVRRIRSEGFSGEAIVVGLHSVLAEAEERRQQLRADATVVRLRSSTSRIAIGMLCAAIVSAGIGLRMRTHVNGNISLPPIAIVLVIIGVVSFGIGMVLLLRNPLSAPADERVFRRLWLGPIGRVLFGFSASSVTTASRAVTRVAPTNNARLDLLEARVEQLERRND